MDNGGGYHGYYTYFNRHLYDTDLAALMPLQNMNLVQPSAHEPVRGQPCLAEPHPGSDSVLQQMLAKQTRQRRSPRPLCSSLGQGRRRGLPLAAAGRLVLYCLVCLQWLCVIVFAALFNPFSLRLSASALIAPPQPPTACDRPGTPCRHHPLGDFPSHLLPHTDQDGVTRCVLGSDFGVKMTIAPNRQVQLQLRGMHRSLSARSSAYLVADAASDCEN
ncbi:hypothetical protein V8C34DRAFT_6404 [Trichoderma compactum]